MQAVILAAGKSTRTYPLTLTRPKPLLKIANRTIIEHTLENLQGIVNEAIIIVGYKKNQIMKSLGKKYKKIRIKYIHQKQQLGTAHALMLARLYIKDKFLMMAGDDLYSREDVKRCSSIANSILVSRVKDPKNFGVIVKKNDTLLDFIEKPKRFISDIVNTSFYCFDTKIFDCLSLIRKSTRDELELPDAIKLLAKRGKVKCIMASSWQPIAYPWDLLRADKILRKNKSSIGGNTKITGSIADSSVGGNCKIYGNIRNSIIMDNCIIKKDSIILDSIIGENVYFFGKIKSKQESYSIIKEKKIPSGKFGAAIGDNCKLENVIIMPGVKIKSKTNIKNKIIANDIE